MSIGYWNISCLSEVYQWCFQSTKADFILGRHGRGRPQKLWNRGPLECDHPKDRPLPVLTLRSAQEFTVTAETASPQVNVHKKRAHTHTHTEIHMQTLAVNPALAHLPLTLMVRVKETFPHLLIFKMFSASLTGLPCQQGVRLTVILSFLLKGKTIKSEVRLPITSKPETSALYVYVCDHIVAS